ncbi:MAG: SDR family NAD(P)-dependent oxidoreductase [Oscillospiraceae bacterium]|nr:SDR family NAD(P)-dependent oxidoreductase [Oscillospiraceae bacterium]
MKMSGNTILITGGATGIGYSMAKYFSARDNEVVICGRRIDRLEQAKKELPGLHTVQCDVTNPDERKKLLTYMNEHFPNMNILINNAGIQRDIDLSKGISELESGESEILVNFEAPVYLSALFNPMITGKDNAAIVHVSSGLAFRAEYSIGVPLYCATKAAIHAFSLTQRKQLTPLGIKVIELIPPAVISELNPEGRKKRNSAVSLYMISSDDYVESALSKMEQGEDEIRDEQKRKL